MFAQNLFYPLLNPQLYSYTAHFTFSGYTEKCFFFVLFILKSKRFIDFLEICAITFITLRVCSHDPQVLPKSHKY